MSLHSRSVENYSIERRMVLVRDRWVSSEQAVTTPLYWAWTGAFDPNVRVEPVHTQQNNTLFVDRRSERSNNSTMLPI